MRRAIRLWIQHPAGVPACLGVFYSLDAALAAARVSVFRGRIWIAA
jgi:hypothetical protein